MKILLVSNMWPSTARPSYGGYVASLAAAVEALGHDLEVVATSEAGGGGVSTLRKYAELEWAARRAARRLRPDVVWAHYLVPTGSIARRLGRPYVVTAHGTDVTNAETSERLRASTAKVVAGAAAVIAVSPELGTRLERVVGSLGDRLQTITAGVDLARFHAGDAEIAAAALGWNASGPRLVAVSNLVPVKNHARLLEAFARAFCEGDGQLAIVGDGELREALELDALRLGIAERVRFVGSVPPTAVPAWLRAADAACLVSEREGFGLALIEALACERSVAASRTVPATVVVTPECGVLCDPLDVDSIAHALVAAVQLRPGSAARAAAEPYALEREAARVAAVLVAAAG